MVTPVGSTGRPVSRLALVVFGHAPVLEPELRNNTINIDTGCVFGGRLTALRYPERELIRSPPGSYAGTARPFLTPPAPALPEWLVHLPSAAIPVRPSDRPGLLEHPAEAFAEFRGQGVDRVICEEMHGLSGDRGRLPGRGDGQAAF